MFTENMFGFILDKHNWDYICKRILPDIYSSNGTIPIFINILNEDDESYPKLKELFEKINQEKIYGKILLYIVEYFSQFGYHIDGRKKEESNNSNYIYKNSGIFLGDIYYKTQKERRPTNTIKQNSTFLTLIKAIYNGALYQQKANKYENKLQKLEKEKTTKSKKISKTKSKKKSVNQKKSVNPKKNKKVISNRRISSNGTQSPYLGTPLSNFFKNPKVKELKKVKKPKKVNKPKPETKNVVEINNEFPPLGSTVKKSNKEPNSKKQSNNNYNKKYPPLGSTVKKSNEPSSKKIKISGKFKKNKRFDKKLNTLPE